MFREGRNRKTEKMVLGCFVFRYFRHFAVSLRCFAVFSNAPFPLYIVIKTIYIFKGDRLQIIVASEHILNS